MTKKIKLISIGVITIILLIFSWYLIDRFSYSKKLSFYPVPVDNDSTLTIGIIGDSWVANEKLDSLLHNELLLKGFKSKILSSGHPGAKSKIIYQNLFEEKTNEHSSKFIIENRPDFCVVIAGVNDAVGQVGADFYSHHLQLIVTTLLHYKIKPIIIELPKFGIIEATNELGYIKSKRNKIYARFTNSGVIDNIKTYRRFFTEELESGNLKDSIILVNFDNVCNAYGKCLELYLNASHLSNKGNEKLSQIIAEEWIKYINPRLQMQAK